MARIEFKLPTAHLQLCPHDRIQFRPEQLLEGGQLLLTQPGRGEGEEESEGETLTDYFIPASREEGLNRRANIPAEIVAPGGVLMDERGATPGRGFKSPPLPVPPPH